MPGLTSLQVRNAKPGRHADGRGLYLMVRDSGSRAWVARVQVASKRRKLMEALDAHLRHSCDPTVDQPLKAASAHREGGFKI